jgi:hypothetical protein
MLIDDTRLFNGTDGHQPLQVVRQVRPDAFAVENDVMRPFRSEPEASCDRA